MALASVIKGSIGQKSNNDAVLSCFKAVLRDN